MKRIILVMISLFFLFSCKNNNLSEFYSEITNICDLKGSIRDIRGYSCSIENTNPFSKETLIYSVQFSAPGIPVSKFESHCCLSVHETYTWDHNKLIEINGKYDDGTTYVKQISYNAKEILVFYVSDSYFSKTYYHLDGKIKSKYIKGESSFVQKDKDYIYNFCRKIVKEVSYRGSTSRTKRYKYNLNGTLREEIYDDDDGFLYRKYYYHNGLLVNSERIINNELLNKTSYKYNNQKQLISEFLDFLEPNRYADRKYEYYDNGLIKVEQSINPCGESNYKYVFEYDTKGNWIKKTVYDYDFGEKLFIPYRIEYRQIEYF